jgi:hypothetical protein
VTVWKHTTGVWPRASFVEGRERSGRALRHLQESGPDHAAGVERVCGSTEVPAPSDVPMPEVGTGNAPKPMRAWRRIVVLASYGETSGQVGHTIALLSVV